MDNDSTTFDRQQGIAETGKDIRADVRPFSSRLYWDCDTDTIGGTLDAYQKSTGKSDGIKVAKETDLTPAM